jgi:gamma-glutamylcyclotransferase (GGCT)/AIG2-like uncharacterized protein YtfP
MSVEDNQTENLFSYGTLQTETVQLAVFDRTFNGKADALIGYTVTMTATGDQEFVIKTGAVHHRNLQFTGVPSDTVEGTVLTVTRRELQQADAYEPSDYERVRVHLKSGSNAWVYLKRQQ